MEAVAGNNEVTSTLIGLTDSKRERGRGGALTPTDYNYHMECVAA